MANFFSRPNRPGWSLLAAGVLIAGVVFPAAASEPEGVIALETSDVVEADVTAGLDYVGKLIVGGTSGHFSFGYAVAVDGDVVVIGAPTALSNHGRAYVLSAFEGTSSFSVLTVTCEHDFMTYPDGDCGRSVAASPDRVAVGFPHWPMEPTLDNLGAVWVADYIGGQWEAWPLLRGSVYGGYFGEAVAFEGDSLATGVPAAGFSVDYGRVDTFEPTGQAGNGHWERQQRLEPGSGEDPDYGWNLDMAGTTLAVGGTGGAYIFHGEPGTYGQPQELVFGEYGQIDVALDGDWLVVGNHDEGGSPPGAVHLYKWNGSKYVEKQVLVPPDGDHELYGWSVAVSGDTILVGDPRDHGEAPYAGAAHRYVYNGSQWAFAETMTAPDAAEEDQFGWDVALSEEWMIIGAPWNDNDGGTDSGAIYVYDRDAGPPPTAECDGLEATIVGTAGHDEIHGTPGFDIIAGLGGPDLILGHGGGDLICGGPGDDTIYGGAGLDRIFGGLGNDVIEGEGGNDQLFGGPGSDRILGRVGADIIKGNQGNDKLYGNGGGDSLYGGPGRDLLAGAAGDDFLYGGKGTDTVTYRSADAMVEVDLGIGIVDGGAGFDILTAINNVIGSSFADLLKGNAAANVIRGGAGGDTIYGKAGNDVLKGGAGTDSIYGGNGTDTCVGEAKTACEL